MTSTTIETTSVGAASDLDAFRATCQGFLAANHRPAAEVDFESNREFLARSAEAVLTSKAELKNGDGR